MNTFAPAQRITMSQLKQAIEQKAYIYGVSAAVSTLLSEFVIDLLISSQYVKPTNHFLVQKTS